MDVGHVIPEAIRELLEQRGTYQGWLTRLDELGNEFRPEVAEKVRGDYASRLATVETELAGHRTELETALSDRTVAVEKVAGEHDARSAELEETQLRHVVGEFDDEEWERRRAEHQVGIDELEAELTTQRSAVESLQTVLNELTGAAAFVAVSEEAELEPPVPDELDATAEDLPEPAEEAESEAAEAELADEAEPWMTQPLDEAVSAADDVATVELVEPEVVERDFADAEYVEAEVVDDEVPDMEESEPEAEATDEESVEAEEAAAVEAAEGESKPEPTVDDAEPEEFLDELEFLESLSLDDADNFDAVSAMLDEDENSGADGESREETEDL